MCCQPYTIGKLQDAMGVDDARECRHVAFVQHVSVMDPGEPTPRRGRLQTSGQAKVDAVRKHRVEQCRAVAAARLPRCWVRNSIVRDYLGQFAIMRSLPVERLSL